MTASTEVAALDAFIRATVPTLTPFIQNGSGWYSGPHAQATFEAEERRVVANDDLAVHLCERAVDEAWGVVR